MTSGYCRLLSVTSQLRLSVTFSSFKFNRLDSIYEACNHILTVHSKSTEQKSTRVCRSRPLSMWALVPNHWWIFDVSDLLSSIIAVILGIVLNPFHKVSSSIYTRHEWVNLTRTSQPPYYPPSLRY